MKKMKRIIIKHEKNSENIIREMSIRQLVFELHLKGFIPFDKNYVWDLSIPGNTFKILTVNTSFFFRMH